MRIEIEDPNEIEAIMEYRRSSTDSKATIQREAAALDTQREMASEAFGMTHAELAKSPEHREALRKELLRVLKQNMNY